MRKAFLLLTMAVLFTSSGLLTSNTLVQAESNAPQDDPTALVESGVDNYTLAAPKIFWHTGIPPCLTNLQEESQNPEGIQSPNDLETIQRIATYGSEKRTLYSDEQECDNGQILSNIVADDNHIYWIGTDGLMQLSTNANTDDPAQLVNDIIQSPGELAIASDRIYAIYANSGSNTKIGYVRKSDYQLEELASPGSVAENLQADGEYVYYQIGDTLKRIAPTTTDEIDLSTEVSGYYPEGKRLAYCMEDPPYECFYTDTVYVGKENSIYTYDNNTNELSSTFIYTSTNPTAKIGEMVTDSDQLFFIENHTTATQPTVRTVDVVFSANRKGENHEAVYTSSTNVLLENLTSDNSYIFWQENDTVQRLPGDTSTLPSVNMNITGIEITQGIQDMDNSVTLIKDRRTFVRLYVKSEGTAVPGVTAQLTKSGFPYPLMPINETGTTITVRPNPNRNDLEQSFLFELPWSWIQNDDLTFTATLNPYEVPSEPDYTDNTATKTFSFVDSPSLSVEFFRLNYNLDETTYSPRITQDVLATYSWIMRTYPIGGGVGENFKPRLWNINGGNFLSNWVSRVDPNCALIYGAEETNLCASFFTNGWLFSYRVDTMMGMLNADLNSNAFYYGMISDSPNNFPRGQAMYALNSVGPSGTPGQFFDLGQGWDTDGTYADWYAAHEIGHSLGREHPNAGSDDPTTPGISENCRHSRSDPNYPYGNTSSPAAPIGPINGSMKGFDVGDPAIGIDRAIYPSSQWNDVMSYCANQWISDYTYEGIYEHMIDNTNSTASETTNTVAAPGDFLVVNGIIQPASNSASFALLRRLDDVVNPPAITPGDYTLRLLDANDAVLADYAFTPTSNHDTGMLTFGQVVNFAAGTRSVQIIKTIGGEILTSVPVSTNSPTIDNVVLKDAISPVKGIVTLTWTASDADNDTLTFEIAYSSDNGASFQPVIANISGNSTQVDTATLGGSSTGIFRVIASDGVNTDYADSAPLIMENKPPQPFILSPEAKKSIHYGQFVNFNGMAMDYQDGTITDSGLEWQDSSGTSLGSGALFSTFDLPVGVNIVTLIATNSLGLSASASVTVTVDDDLNLPGPTLTAAPAQVNWQVENGSTTPKTADITINNSGSGELNWTASENASWLTLSVSSGTVSSEGDALSLTLNADPSGLDGDQTHTTDIIISNNNQEQEQTVTIHVSLSIGDIHTVPAETDSYFIYLPALAR